jgi:hypothetical protein
MFFVALSFQPNPSITMGGTDRCGILFYGGSTTADIGLLLAAPIPLFLPHEAFSMSVNVWRGAVDIASASGTRRPGFESHKGVRFLGKHSSVVVFKMT